MGDVQNIIKCSKHVDSAINMHSQKLIFSSWPVNLLFQVVNDNIQSTNHDTSNPKQGIKHATFQALDNKVCKMRSALCLVTSVLNN